MRSILDDLSAVAGRVDLDDRGKRRARSGLKAQALADAAVSGRVRVPGGSASVERIGDSVRCVVDLPVPDPVYVFHNPPVLVPDPAGPIERFVEHPETGEMISVRYREDHLEALETILAEALAR